MPHQPPRSRPRPPRADRAARERPVRFGNYEARKRGVRRLDLRDPYRIAVALSWPRFMLALLGAELGINFLFALLYVARPGAVANMHSGSLLDAFFFSIETLATVGYGEMYPADLYGHLVSATEIIVGVAFVAVVTGLIFVRVSRPKPPFRFPAAIVVTAYRGKPTLMIRTASDGLGVLYDAQARLSVLAPEEAGDAHRFRNIVDLPLIRSNIPVFALSWTLMHVIDETSPLWSLDRARMEAGRVRLFLMMEAADATLATTVRDLRAYTPDEVHFGMRYADALSISEDGHPVLDLRLLGVVEGDGD